MVISYNLKKNTYKIYFTAYIFEITLLIISFKVKIYFNLTIQNINLMFVNKRS